MNDFKRFMIGWLLIASFVFAQHIPVRQADAQTGSEFMNNLLNTEFTDREPLILKAFSEGNVPEFYRHFKTVRTYSRDAEGKIHRVVYRAAKDYLCIGNDEDYCRVPMGPFTAQAIADAYGCILTTTKLCDDIWLHADIHLDPIPYYPVGDNNSQVYKFIEHDRDIDAACRIAGANKNDLIAGTKKDVVICNALAEKQDRVALYGWHYPDGKPIQPLYTGHVNWYVDYSHGIRLIDEIVKVDGRRMNAHDILKDPILYKLLSNESAPMRLTRY